ncbi:MAG: DUF1836 domain-containing protein [Dorea sp.]|nr:DUF1836 domain-containing protein [Dorea sp.]
MDANLKKIMKDLLVSIQQINYVQSANIPNINLYMDQVTTFMEEELESTKRYPEDKILTKTMINNYAKNHLLPSPEKKKYTKEHVLLLTFIYYFKQILSIKDIETILKPITENYFEAYGSIDIAQIYDEIVDFEKSRIKGVMKDVVRTFTSSMECFDDVEGLSEEELEYLKKFTFICTLSFDVYIKKRLIETMIDDLNET